MNKDMKFFQFNFNTLVTSLALAGILWVVRTNQTLSVEVAEIKVMNTMKIEQINRMSIQFDHLQAQMNDMQVELVRIKFNTKP